MVLIIVLLDNGCVTYVRGCSYLINGHSVYYVFGLFNICILITFLICTITYEDMHTKLKEKHDTMTTQVEGEKMVSEYDKQRRIMFLFKDTVLQKEVKQKRFRI